MEIVQFMYKCNNPIRQVCTKLTKKKLKTQRLMIKKKKMKIRYKIHKKRLNYKSPMKASLMNVFNLKIIKIHLWLVPEAKIINNYKNKETINKFYRILVRILWGNVSNCKKLFILPKEMQIKSKGQAFKIKKLFMIL